MRQTLYATRSMKHPSYKGRVLRAGEEFTADGPTARLYCAMGAATTEAPVRVEDDIAILRSVYEARLGKRPFMGWSAETLREKIAAA